MLPLCSHSARGVGCATSCDRYSTPVALLTRLLRATSALFGPPSIYDPDGQPGRIESARVSAALVALGAKMAKADGQVRAEDVAAFNDVFHFAPEQGRDIARLFDLASRTTLGADGYARMIARRFRARPAALEDVMDGLFHIALADGVVTDDEDGFLRSVAESMGLSRTEFLRIRAAHLGPDLDDPYLLLGVDRDASDEDLRRAYRRMAANNHPDRLMARGVPPELQRVATRKMAMINTAYRKVQEERTRERGKHVTTLSDAAA